MKRRQNAKQQFLGVSLAAKQNGRTLAAPPTFRSRDLPLGRSETKASKLDLDLPETAEGCSKFDVCARKLENFCQNGARRQVGCVRHGSEHSSVAQHSPAPRAPAASTKTSTAWATRSAERALARRASRQATQEMAGSLPRGLRARRRHGRQIPRRLLPQRAARPHAQEGPHRDGTHHALYGQKVVSPVASGASSTGELGDPVRVRPGSRCKMLEVPGG